MIDRGGRNLGRGECGYGMYCHCKYSVRVEHFFQNVLLLCHSYFFYVAFVSMVKMSIQKQKTKTTIIIAQVAMAELHLRNIYIYST